VFKDVENIGQIKIMVLGFVVKKSAEKKRIVIAFDTNLKKPT
jgi:hypothetical protein